MTTKRRRDQDPPPPATAVAGPRHLRVGLLVGPRTVRVSSVAVADGVPAQPLAAGHPWLAAVTRGEEVVHLARVQDPLEQRSTRRTKGGDHHVSRHGSGLVVVSVPFASLTDLTRSTINVLALPGDTGPADAATLTGVLRERTSAEGATGEVGGGAVRTVGFAEIAASRHWPAVAARIGVSAPPGAFEVYRDRAGEYRWRLRAAGGEVVAASADGFRTRAACEAEVTWVRRHAAASPTRALDDPTAPG